MSSPKSKKRKKSPYSRLAPVGYSEQYRRWNLAAKKGDVDGTTEADAVHRRYLASRPWAQKIETDAAPALKRAA